MVQQRQSDRASAVTSATEYDALPTDVVPHHYAVSLFDFITVNSVQSYHGRVEIQLEVRQPTTVIVLNANKIEVNKAIVRYAEGQEARASSIECDVRKQRCIITLSEAIPVSAETVTLTLDFHAQVDEALCGFYRFKDTFLAQRNISHEYTSCTQFQPSDARRAFPCFDEPGLKATFDFSIEVPTALTAISNMPVHSRTTNKYRSGFDVVEFERTPVMSTYLLAWAVSDFEYVDTTIRRRHSGEPLPIRVYTPPTQKESGRFALHLASRVIDYFSEVFQIDYPLPKLDLLGVLEMSDDAMENWGLVIFRSTALLIDEKTSDLDTITTAAYVIAHELAHQWFGNLVTPFWWNNLWLNEGFATWAGWAAIDHFYPQWDVWGRFIVDDMQEAMQLDGLPSSHPVQVPVPDGLEVDAIFDSISYLKSASIIRMLAGHLGAESFLQGVANYLKAHLYSSGSAEELWKALSATSGQDIASLMEPWIKTMGYPLVTVEAGCNDHCEVRQNMFSLVGPRNEIPQWWIPLRVLRSTGVDAEVLTGKSITINANYEKLNAGQTGFFRTLYDSDKFQRLCENAASLTSHDRAGLLCDSLAAISAGCRIQSSDLLSVLKYFSQADDAVTWMAIDTVLDKFHSIFADDEEISDGLDELTYDLAKAKFEQLRWVLLPDESYNSTILRPIIISLAGFSGEGTCSEQACEMFHLWMKGDEQAIHPYLKPVVLAIAVAFLGTSAVDHLFSRYKQSRSSDERAVIAEAMGTIQDEELAMSSLKHAFEGDAMVAQDLQSFTVALAENTTTRSIVWDFIREQWDLVLTRLSGSMAIFNPFVQQCLQTLALPNSRKEVEQFFANKDVTGYGRGLEVAKSVVEVNATWRSRDLEEIRKWLGENGYAGTDTDSDSA